MGAPLIRRGGRSIGRQAVMEQDIRRLMARELHDRVAQTLTAMLVDVENFKSQQVGWDDVLKEMETIQSSTRQVLSSLRQLLHDLRGENPVGDSFVEAIRALMSRFGERSQIAGHLDVSPEWPHMLTPAASLNLYRIIEEALGNVQMYSGAQSVRIGLETWPNDELVVVVDDDGRGLDPSLSRPVGLGTIGMRERALLLGGQLRIVSGVGAGTKVQAEFSKQFLIPTTQPEQSRELVPQGV